MIPCIHTCMYIQLQEKENFLVLFHRFIEEGLFNINLGLTETITHSAEASLNNIRSRDINIIVGFFGPKNARDILCLVSHTEYDYLNMIIMSYQ